jgi:hypothetical protein
MRRIFATPAMMILLCLGSLLCAGQSQPKKRLGLGVGAFPLSYSHTAAWFATQSGEKKTVAVLIYFVRNCWLAFGTDEVQLASE